MEYTWQSLPQELLSAIFEHVHDKCDLLQLQLVCTSWTYVAYQNLYHSITVDEDTIDMLVETLVESKYEPRFHVKSIEFSDGSSDFEPGDDIIEYLATLVHLCPNVSRVEANNEERLLYEDLLYLYNEGYLQHIQYLPDYNYGSLVSIKNSYNNAVVAMKDTLARLFIENIQYQQRESKQTPDINMVERLQDFPRLEQLEIAFSSSNFFYEMEALIENCSHLLKSMKMVLDNDTSSVHTFQQLGQITQRPQIKSLHVNATDFTARDLQYIMLKFTGLEKLIIDNEGFDNIDAIDRLVADGLFSSQVYLDAFKYMITLNYFRVGGLSIPIDVEETLAFWAKRPQLKAMTIRGSGVIAKEEVCLLVKNTRGETEFQHKNDGAWEMELELYYHDFATSYKQTLEKFSGDTIEHIRLLLLGLSEPDAESALGDSLGYILDHYTAVKEILLQDARLLSFHARTTGKQLKRLKFLNCYINPDVMLQLSTSVSRIGKLDIDRTIMPNEDPNNRCLCINMPHTSFGIIRVWPANVKPYLIKLCKVSPNGSTQTARYHDVGGKGCLEIDEIAYNDRLSEIDVHRAHNVIVIHYRNLQTLTISGKYRCNINIGDDE